MPDASTLILLRTDRILRERIVPAIHRAIVPVEATAWEAPGEPVPFAEATANATEPFPAGTPWGRPWGTTWLRIAGAVPEGWSAEDRVELLVDLGFGGGPGFTAEGMFFAEDGRVLKGLEPFNTHVRVAAAPGEPFVIWLEAASNPDIGGRWGYEPTPLGSLETAPPDPLYVFGGARIGILDREVFELERDLSTLRGLAGALPEGSTRRAGILHALDRAADALDPEDVSGSAPEVRAALADALAAHTASSAHRVAAVGHAHIDSAWLWPVRETQRKVARTFSNVLDLMDEHPEFVFAASSAQQYAWMRDRYPELYERMRARIAEGRFVPVGGMWVESDTNLPGGEALARQFVAGKGFFLREFGIETDEVWLPDSFGYSAGLPQIVAASNTTNFLTQKISWNETNVMPHHTFLWEGIDGTRIFTHFPPVDTYNSDLSAEDLARAERQHSEAGLSDLSLVPYGYGDGGGGPTREMIATAHRKRDLDGSPRVELTRPDAFFAAARAELPEPSVWSGELYLEFHRGTYTSQSRTKHGNRRSEHLLREAELWAATAAIRTGAEYPAEALREVEETVLLQQFHDILPGSSIAWVHREAERGYAAVAERLEGLIADALGALGGDARGGEVGALGADALRPLGADALGPLGGDVTAGEVAEHATAPLGALGGDATAGEVAYNASPFPVDGVPALGSGVASAARSAAREEDGLSVLESEHLRAAFDADGHLVSLVDAATGREAVPVGLVGNELQLYRDTPTQWDAWDLDNAYQRMRLATVRTTGVALRDDGLEVRIDLGHASSATQRIRLSPDGRALEIETEVDWHARQKLLKLAFPFDVHATTAASEIQFGHVRRATHRNTSWDAARFETSGHRWVHVDEPGFGVTVANDRVYGRDVTVIAPEGRGTATLVRESLLRAPMFPDPDADQGRHVFRHSIAVGDVLAGVAEGYRLNLPLRRVAGVAVEPLVRVEGDASVVVEAVKLAEDGSGDVVVRLYEARGGRARGRLVPGFAAGTTTRTDLLERDLDHDGDPLELRLRAFELVTLRIRRA